MTNLEFAQIVNRKLGIPASTVLCLGSRIAKHDNTQFDLAKVAEAAQYLYELPVKNTAAWRRGVDIGAIK